MKWASRQILFLVRLNLCGGIAFFVPTKPSAVAAFAHHQFLHIDQESIGDELFFFSLALSSISKHDHDLVLVSTYTLVQGLRSMPVPCTGQLHLLALKYIKFIKAIDHSGL